MLILCLYIKFKDIQPADDHKLLSGERRYQVDDPYSCMTYSVSVCMCVCVAY